MDTAFPFSKESFIKTETRPINFLELAYEFLDFLNKSNKKDEVQNEFISILELLDNKTFLSFASSLPLHDELNQRFCGEAQNVFDYILKSLKELVINDLELVNEIHLLYKDDLNEILDNSPGKHATYEPLTHKHRWNSNWKPLSTDEELNCSN